MIWGLDGMKEKDRSIWIFDLDDTLRWTSHEYSLQIAKFAHYLYKTLKQRVPYMTQLVQLQEEIDVKLTKTGGLSRDRFPQSFVAVYHDICKKGWILVNPKIEKYIYDMGSEVFKSKEAYREAGFIEGAEETLEFLLEKKDLLYLVTRGENDIQQNKIDGLRLERYIRQDNIFIVNPDKQPVFHAISENQDKNKVMVVEDSLEIVNVATISPLELRAIYIPSPTGTWKYENQGNGLKNPSRVKKFSKIIEIKERYAELLEWRDAKQ